ncbi:Calx-beta domain-containing protein [Paractinoplanes toevensis]|uniref:Calx-beta domain-containing protein n=1 Tax=Paractinoplanes toevensis TaxID=571911 RepID=UPI001BB3FC57|nr:Calx-beta domain-containing protein [Actinoplanes toevensis]
MPFTLWGPGRIRNVLAGLAAAAVGLVPTVMIASPAQAAPIDFLKISDAANWENGDLVFTVTYTGTTANASFDFATATGSAGAGDFDSTLDSDYFDSGTTIIFNAASASAPATATITVHTTDDADNTDAASEKFTLTAIPTGGQAPVVSGTGTIWNLDTTNSVVLTGGTTVPETASGGVQRAVTITATQTNPQQHDVVIPVRTFDGTDGTFKTSNAVAAGGINRDYSALAADATITIPANETTGTTQVSLWDDANDEADTQDFSVGVDTSRTPGGLDVFGGTMVTGQTSAKINITDDDATPVISIGDAATVKEGAPLIFPLSLTTASERGVTYNLNAVGATKGSAGPATGDNTGGNSATADFRWGTGGTGDATSLTVPLYAKAANVLIPTLEQPLDNNSDPVFEGPENVRAKLTVPNNGANATLGSPAIVDGMITDTGSGQDIEWSDVDDPFDNTWNQRWTETSNGPVEKKIWLRFAAGTTLPDTLSYKFVDVDAKNGVDYIGKDGTVTIPANSATPNYVSIPVTITGDRIFEPDETFKLVLTDPNGIAELPTNGEVTFTIVDDDSKPIYTTGDVSIQEGNAGTTIAKVPLKLNTPAGTDAVFTAQISTGSATENASTPGGNDYDLPKDLTATIKAGDSIGWLEVPIVGDAIYERDESFTVDFTNGEPSNVDHTSDSQRSSKVTITNDDAQPTVTFASASGSEGGKVAVVPTVVGESQYQYDIGFSAGAAGDHPATVGTDFEIPTNLVTSIATVPAGYTGALNKMPSPFDVPAFQLLHDDIDEPTETFSVTANEVTSVLRGFTTASTMVKVNDDPMDLPPAASIGDIAVDEKQHVAKVPVDLAFTGDATSTVQTVTIPWYTQDGTAKAGFDYKASKGTLQVPPGTMKAWIEVPVIDDHSKEPNENFTVRLGTPGPLGASVIKGDSTVTVKSDDTVDTSLTLTVAGTVSGGVNTPIWGKTAPGADVELWGAPISAKNAPLAKLATVKAGKDGVYKFTRTLSQGYRFKVASGGDESMEKRVMVTQAPVFVASSPSKGVVSFAVQGTPRGVGQVVIVQKWVGGKWVNTWKGTTGSSNQWKATAKVASGSLTVRAFVQGFTPNGIGGGYSASKKITVK